MNEFFQQGVVDCQLHAFCCPSYFFANYLIKQVEHDQAKQLVESFKAPTDLRGSGLLYCGIRYKCVRTDKNSIYAKHVSNHRFNNK